MKAPAALLLMGKPKPKDDGEAADDDEHESAGDAGALASSILRAVKANDPDALARSLSKFVDLCMEE